MWTIKPLLLSICMGTNILAYIPSHFNKRIGILIKILMLKTWLIKYQQKIPIRTVVPVSTCTRPIEIQQTTLG